MAAIHELARLYSRVDTGSPSIPDNHTGNIFTDGIIIGEKQVTIFAIIKVKLLTDFGKNACPTAEPATGQRIEERRSKLGTTLNIAAVEEVRAFNSILRDFGNDTGNALAGVLDLFDMHHRGVIKATGSLPELRPTLLSNIPFLEVGRLYSQDAMQVRVKAAILFVPGDLKATESATDDAPKLLVLVVQVPPSIVQSLHGLGQRIRRAVAHGQGQEEELVTLHVVHNLGHLGKDFKRAPPVAHGAEAVLTEVGLMQLGLFFGHLKLKKCAAFEHSPGTAIKSKDRVHGSKNVALSSFVRELTLDFLLQRLQG